MRESYKVFFRSRSGKVGLTLFLLLLSISLYVISVYPLDFGVRYWNNPAYWADYPKTVPPFWYNFFVKDPKPEHRIIISNGIFRFNHIYNEPPNFTSLIVKNVTNLEIYLKRPDYDEPILLKRVYLVSKVEELRISLTSDQDVAFEISNFLYKNYGLRINQQDLLARGNDIALYGKVEEGKLVALKGNYEIIINPRVKDAKLILGGNVYGLMGTDSLGRDLFTGLLFGFPVALFIGSVVAFLVALIGSFLGIWSGYLGGKSDTLIQRISDILVNMPLLPLLIFLTFILGQKLWLVLLILIAFGWPGLTILIRSMTLQIKSFQFIEAAKALGSSKVRIVVKHIFPQTAPFVLAQMIFSIPSAILAEAALSFLGLGDPSLPTWGQILELGFRRGGIYAGYWWWILPPGILIVISSFTFLLLALALEPLINPRLRRI